MPDLKGPFVARLFLAAQERDTCPHLHRTLDGAIHCAIARQRRVPAGANLVEWAAEHLHREPIPNDQMRAARDRVGVL